jgi:hypothetical protein
MTTTIELQALADNLMAMACDTSNELTAFDRKTASDAAAQLSLMADRIDEQAVPRNREAQGSDLIPTVNEGKP